MRSGPMRHRITLQTQTQTRSATGAFTRTWANAFTCWADILPTVGKAGSRGTERFVADTQTSDLPIRVIIRYSTDVASLDTSWRIKYGTRYFDINSVANNRERDEMLTLMCSESKRDDE